MTIRSARPSDFDHLETFVWQAIFPAFDIDGLTEAQRAENDRMVEEARSEVMSVLGRDHFGVFVAIEPRNRTLAGYVVVDARPRAYAEVRRLIVKRTYHGKGVGELLLDEATEFIGPDRAVSLTVRHYNQRALAFFAKHGFVDTGEIAGDHAIPRALMLREANTVGAPTIATDENDAGFGSDFPSATDEPLFEPLPDYSLATDEAPLFETGSNALRTEDPDEGAFTPSSLSEEQLSVLESFIAQARARKSGTAAAQSSARQSGEHRGNQPTGKVKPTTAAYDRRKIAFEVDYGDGVVMQSGGSSRPPLTPRRPVNVPVEPSFSFDFAPVSELDPLGEHVVAPAGMHSNGSSLPGGHRGSHTLPKANAPAHVAEQQPDPERTGPPVAEPLPTTERPVTTKTCPGCTAELPAAARFCLSCGLPQPVPVRETAKSVSPTQDPPHSELDVLEELPPLPEDDHDRSDDRPAPDAETIADNFVTPDFAAEDADRVVAEAVADATSDGAPSSQNTDEPQPGHPVSVGDLRKAFERFLRDRMLSYFAERKLPQFLERLAKDEAFQQVRDGSLTSLYAWLKTSPAADLARVRRQNTFADLAEYFIVETAADLSGNVLPQRLLRHQSADWQTADLFRLVTDYLDFDAESEIVYTDFVKMPPRALKNATKSFLHAAKDERVFFICDQSLISQAKNGFAVTDSGIYWKNVLQPAGAATFTTMREPRISQGHLLIDGQFFDAGSRLNLKIAVLLDKLRRMR